MKLQEQDWVMLFFENVKCAVMAAIEWHPVYNGRTMNSKIAWHGREYSYPRLHLSKYLAISNSLCRHFLIARSSKLLKVSSRGPLEGATARVDDFGSNPGCSLCDEVRRPLFESNLPDRPSLGSPEELGLLFEITAFLVLLP